MSSCWYFQIKPVIGKNNDMILQQSIYFINYLYLDEESKITVQCSGVVPTFKVSASQTSVSKKSNTCEMAYLLIINSINQLMINYTSILSSTIINLCNKKYYST